MKIKITPENDMERQRVKEVIHTGVQDFFIMGNKKNEDGLEDFSDWKGSFRFLIGSLYYFLNQITEEQNIKKNAPEIDVKSQPVSSFKPQMFKTGDANEMKVINAEEIEQIMKNNGENLESPKKYPLEDEFTIQKLTQNNESQPED